MFDKPRTGHKRPAGEHFNRFKNKRAKFEGDKNRGEHNKFDRFKGKKAGFDKNKFSNNKFKGKGRDKTNSRQRDQRPIGKVYNKKR